MEAEELERRRREVEEKEDMERVASGGLPAFRTGSGVEVRARPESIRQVDRDLPDVLPVQVENFLLLGQREKPEKPAPEKPAPEPAPELAPEPTPEPAPEPEPWAAQPDELLTLERELCAQLWAASVRRVALDGAAAAAAAAATTPSTSAATASAAASATAAPTTTKPRGVKRRESPSGDSDDEADSFGRIWPDGASEGATPEGAVVVTLRPRDPSSRDGYYLVIARQVAGAIMCRYLEQPAAAAESADLGHDEDWSIQDTTWVFADAAWELVCLICTDVPWDTSAFQVRPQDRYRSVACVALLDRRTCVVAAVAAHIIPQPHVVRHSANEMAARGATHTGLLSPWTEGCEQA